MQEREQSRRRFLTMAIGAAGAVKTLGCSSGVGPQSVGKVSAGNASALSVGTVRQVGSQPVAIGRDANGIYAMTLTCTHAGCDVEVLGTQLQCPCHGSRFDATGNVLAGPAPSPLQHFAVTADAQGALTVDTGSVVDQAARLKV